MIRQIEKVYFGLRVVAFKANDWSPFPWEFYVFAKDGNKHQFLGIRNKCETSRAALRRAWWRAKWLADGTFSERYK